MPINHQYVSAVADSGDPNVVQPSDWNATHTLPVASEIAVTDTGSYYTSANVEDILQEVGDLLAMSGAGGGAITDGVDSNIKATVFDYSSSNPLAVRLSDTNGDYVSTFAVTQSTISNLKATVTIVDGAGDSCMDNTNDALRVNIVAGAGSGGTSATDDAAFTAASGAGTPMMGFVASDSVDSGDVGVVGMLANRQLKVTLYDSSGSELSVGGGTQYTEDAAAAANPVGNAIIAVRDDARGGSITTTDGDNIALRANNYGELYVKHTDTIAATQSGTWNITNVSGTVSLPTGAATAANQSTIIGHVDGIEGLLTTIDSDTSSLVGCVGGTELQVDIVGALPAGTNAIGKLAANDGVDIGDVTINNASIAVTQSGTWNITNISGTISLPTGAATAAKQPALGTAGSASSDVITVQGIASMTALKVDGSAVTQPVSGTLTGITNVVHVDDNSGSLTVDGTVTATMSNGKTLTSKGGTVSSSGDNTIVAAGSNKLKVYAFSLTTTSTTAVTCIFQSGASGTELWRCTLQAISGASTGANLAVSPPAWLFATASATLLNINLSSAQTVHYSVSYFDEA